MRTFAVTFALLFLDLERIHPVFLFMLSFGAGLAILQDILALVKKFI